MLLIYIIHIMSIYKRYTDFIKHTQLMLPPEKWFFKSDINYTYMLEHVNKNQGFMYLNLIKENFKNFYENNITEIINMCKINDTYGQTIKVSFDDNLICSPTNLRYIYFSLLIINDLKKYNIQNPDIIEIGGGYGGLCFILSKIAELCNITINSYVIFDLIEASLLQKKYLDALKIKNVSFYQINTFKNIKKDSFLISTYSFSEIPLSIQNEYSEKVLNPFVKYGFIAWNNIPVYNFIKDCEIKKEIEIPKIGRKHNYYVRFYKNN